MRETVIATGFFDGVHLGHAEVIKALAIAASKRDDCESLVVTFSSHPLVALGKACGIEALSTPSEKTRLLLSMGAQRVEVLDFTPGFAAMSAGQYVDFLKEKFGAVCLVLGYDNRLGCDGKRYGQIEGIPTICVPPRIVGGAPVSSTRIREALSKGEVEKAQALLARPYSIEAEVVRGKRLGRTIGFPTANLSSAGKLIPSPGVYGGEAFFDGRQFPAMINVSRQGLVEAHLPGFSGDLYGKTIRVSFERRIRPEMEFASVRELQAQLLKDRESF